MTAAPAALAASVLRQAAELVGAQPHARPDVVGRRVASLVRAELAAGDEAQALRTAALLREVGAALVDGAARGARRHDASTEGPL